MCTQYRGTEVQITYVGVIKGLKGLKATGKLSHDRLYWFVTPID